MKRLCSVVSLALLVASVQAALPSQCRGEDEKKPEKVNKKQVKLGATSGGPIADIGWGWVQVDDKTIPLATTAATNWADAAKIKSLSSVGALRKIPENAVEVGTTIHVQQRGVIQVPAAGNQINVKIQLGAATAETGNIALEVGTRYWELDAYITVLSTGSAATAKLSGRVTIEGATNPRMKAFAASLLTFNSAVQNPLDTLASSPQAGLMMTSNFGQVD